MIQEGGFLAVKNAPLSTFSIDVDTASYAKTRAYLLEHHALPPPDSVRIEELINYFDYAYAGPTDEHPFAGFQYVRQFDSMLIEPPIYLAALVDEVRLGGADIRVGEKRRGLSRSGEFRPEFAE